MDTINKTKPGISVIILTLYACVLLMAMCGPASAWLSGYDHRMAITVNNGGAPTLNYYQFNFTNDTNTLVAAGHMQANGADCRVTDSNDNLIPLWNDTAFNAPGTKIWANATTLAVGDNTFYMYYGNAAASSVSNGYDVFKYLEDYEYFVPSELYRPSPQMKVGVSDVLELHNGDILLAYSTKESGLSYYDVWIRNSTDRGKTYSYVSAVTSGATVDRGPEGLFQLSNGTVICCYNQGWAQYFKASYDNGSTWGVQQSVASIADGNMILLSSGRWLSVGIPGGRTLFRSTYSDDDGNTWSSLVTIGSATNSFEDSNVIQLSNDKIIANTEDEAVEGGNTVIEQYNSTDSGASWTFELNPLGGSDSYDYEAGEYVETNTTGEVILTYSTDRYFGGGYTDHTHGYLISDDYGASWGNPYIMKTVPLPVGGIEHIGLWLDDYLYTIYAPYADYFIEHIHTGKLGTHSAFWNEDVTGASMDYSTNKNYTGLNALHFNQTSGSSGGHWHNPTTQTLPYIAEWRLYDNNDTTAHNIMQIYDGSKELKIGIFTGSSATHYLYKDGSTWYVSSVSRSVGWHNFKAAFNASGGVKIYCDGVLMGEHIGYSDLNQMRIWGIASHLSEWWMDNLIVRSYADPGPTSSLGAEEDAPSAPYTPSTPTTLANTTGNYWVNHTWTAGTGNVTDSYNISVNSVWHNTTPAYYNNTGLSAHAWSNITVYAYNSSSTGALSADSISQNTQIITILLPTTFFEELNLICYEISTELSNIKMSNYLVYAFTLMGILLIILGIQIITNNIKR